MLMKKMFIGLYAAIALLVILVTFSMFVHGIIKDSDAGAEEARTTFAYFARQIIFLSEKQNFAEQSYNENLYNLSAELELKAFIISKTSKEVIISWPKDSDLISYDDEGNFIIRPDSLFVKNFRGKIKVKVLQDQDVDLMLTASISTLKPEIIYLRLRTAFLIILAVTVITLIMILITHLSTVNLKIAIPQTKSNTNESETEDVNKALEREHPFEESYHFDEKPSETQEDTYTQKEFVDETEKSSPIEENNNEYSLDDLDNLSITKQFPYENNTTSMNEEEKKIYDIKEEQEEELKNTEIGAKEDNGTVEEEKVRGLYSPITGISWEEYLPEYLESELRRAASSEQDLAFIIIKLDDFTLESLIGKKIANLLIDFIKFRDMIFEFDSNGFAAILQDTNLEEAMKKAEEIYKGIKNILTEYDISKSVSIGITTRTSRLISSDRMVEEAYAAVSRAINNNEDPIVAFRVNPDKYREFISEN